MEIGEIIKEKRLAAGLTQEVLAQKAGCATITIRQYESGKREPNITALSNIADALGVDILDLIPTEPQKDPLSGLTEDEREYIAKISGGNEAVQAVLSIFLRLPDAQKLLFLKELKRLSAEAEVERKNAVDPKENE